MTEVEIFTPRGAVLSGTFVNPVDSGDAAVLFSHSLLSERQSGRHFTQLAKLYRAAGYATLQFDYSGHGLSSDEPIELDSMVEDLRSASGWLADQGFGRQLLHGHSFGTVTALRARPTAVRALILSSAILGPLYYDWKQIFSAAQLEELDRTGAMRIPDDSDGPRTHFVLSKQTLRDISLNSSEQLVADLPYPVLAIHDVEDEQDGLLQMTTEVFPQFKTGSRIEAAGDIDHAERLAYLNQAATRWAEQHLPVRP